MTKKMSNSTALKELYLRNRVVTLGEALVFLIVAERKDQIPMQEIQDELDMPASTISRVAYNLVENRYLEYRPIEGDRRAKALALGKKGQKLMEMK